MLQAAEFLKVRTFTLPEGDVLLTRLHDTLLSFSIAHVWQLEAFSVSPGLETLRSLTMPDIFQG